MQKIKRKGKRKGRIMQINMMIWRRLRKFFNFFHRRRGDEGSKKSEGVLAQINNVFFFYKIIKSKPFQTKILKIFFR